MKFSTTSALLLGASLASQATAGILYVDNLCHFPVYLRTETGNAQPSGVFTLPANKTNAYHETLRPPPAAYNAISIGLYPALSMPLQVAYTQTTQPPAPGKMYYDLSTVFGSPFQAYGFELLSGGNGYSIKCPPRRDAQPCPYTYNPENKNGNGALFTQGNQYNLVLRLCRST